MMTPQNPDFKNRLMDVFNQAAFVVDLGIHLVDVGAGWCETELQVLPRHGQQNGYVHAGVQATMADHSAGGAAATLVAANQYVLTVEFKINLLRPAQGERLVCRAQVLKPGRTLSFVELEVRALSGEKSTLVSKAAVTIAIMEP